MSLIITRSVITKLLNGTNIKVGRIRPGLLYLNKISYSTAEDKNVTANKNPSVPPTLLHTPSNWDKRFLVWTKKYPSLDQVPAQVSRETLDKSRNKARIYINLLMAGLTVIASIAMIISGKRAAKKGHSVQQMNLDWHQSHK